MKDAVIDELENKGVVTVPCLEKAIIAYELYNPKRTADDIGVYLGIPADYNKAPI